MRKKLRALEFLPPSHIVARMKQTRQAIAFLCCGIILTSCGEKVSEVTAEKVSDQPAKLLPPTPAVPPVVNLEPPQARAPIQTPEFATQYKQAEAKALREFPELGIAGSAFNLLFLKYVRDQQARSSEHFKSPEWPYNFAKLVNEEISKIRAEEKRRATTHEYFAPPPVFNTTSAPAPVATMPTVSSGTHWVNEFTRKDGTVVRGHWSANPTR